MALAIGAEAPKTPPSKTNPVQDKPATPPPAVLLNYHEAHLRAFVESPGNGFSRTMTLPLWRPQLMALTMPGPGSGGVVTYERALFLLVGLLKHESPVVYDSVWNQLSGTHPRSQAAKPPSTRPLDSFETAALDRLLRGEQLVVKGPDADGVRMMGAVRAQADCLTCHEDVREGTLLGAFTYLLSPESPDKARPLLPR